MGGIGLEKAGQVVGPNGVQVLHQCDCYKLQPEGNSIFFYSRNRWRTVGPNKAEDTNKLELIPNKKAINLTSGRDRQHFALSLSRYEFHLISICGRNSWRASFSIKTRNRVARLVHIGIFIAICYIIV